MRIAQRAILIAALFLALPPALGAWSVRSYSTIDFERRGGKAEGGGDRYDLRIEESALVKLPGIVLIGKASQDLIAWESSRTAAGLGVSFGYLDSFYSSLIFGGIYYPTEDEFTGKAEIDANYESERLYFGIAQRVTVGAESMWTATTAALSWRPIAALEASATYGLYWGSGTGFDHALWGHVQASPWGPRLGFRAGGSIATSDAEEYASPASSGLAASISAGIRSDPIEGVSLGYDFGFRLGEDRQSHSFLLVLAF